MNTYIAAVRSETTKVFSVRLWWILALIMFGYVGLCAGGIGAAFAIPGLNGSSGEASPEITSVFTPALVYSTVTAIGYVFPVLFGALATTIEFRHQTLTPTFLATPRRGTALAAKVTVLTVFGAIYGVIGVFASVGVGATIVAMTGTDTLLGEADTWALLGRAVIAMALWSMIGVGLGVLVPSQVAAIVIVLAFTQFVEPILRIASSFVDWTRTIGRFLPGAASDALVGSSVLSLATGGGDPLEWWQGGLVLLAIAIVVTVAGYFTSWRRDVT